MIALQHYPENLLALPEMKEMRDEFGHIMKRGMQLKVYMHALDRCIELDGMWRNCAVLCLNVDLLPSTLPAECTCLHQSLVLANVQERTPMYLGHAHECHLSHKVGHSWCFADWHVHRHAAAEAANSRGPCRLLRCRGKHCSTCHGPGQAWTSTSRGEFTIHSWRPHTVFQNAHCTGAGSGDAERRTD